MNTNNKAMNSEIRQNLTGISWWSGIFVALLIIVFTALSACSESDDNSGDVTDSGEVVIGLTDAEGDFGSYTVDVLSLTLTRADGAVVETLPLTTRVDFAQYTDMTEFLTAATVPSGVYVKASMVLDYSDADIWVEDGAGDLIQAQTIQDISGNPINSLEVSVHLEHRKALLIAPGIPAHITLDFELSASNSVDFTVPDQPVVTVQPVLLADLELERPKIHRLRGPLKHVDPDNNRFTVILRPFHHPLKHDHERFGTLLVKTHDATVYSIDGERYEGKAGLLALSAKPVFTATVVIGDLKFNPRRFEARQVYAGSSVPGGSLDVVHGSVLQRMGNTFSVKGATLIRAGGSIVFNDVVTVQVADTTRVHQQFSMAEHDIGDISVGQRVRIFGTLGDEMPGQIEMDASEGFVHMLLTVLKGTRLGVVSIAESPLPFVMDLQAINGRRVALFDFEGTGIDPDHDADPNYYEINTGTLDTSGIFTDAPLKVGGFVQPFGQAPADFNAQTLVDVSQLPAVMAINWVPPLASAFSEISETAIVLNLDGVGPFHFISRGGVRTDLLMSPTNPSVQPRVDGLGVFVIEQNQIVQLHTSFMDFTADITDRLANSAQIKGMAALGHYSDTEAVLTTGRMGIRLE